MAEKSLPRISLTLLCFCLAGFSVDGFTFWTFLLDLCWSVSDTILLSAWEAVLVACCAELVGLTWLCQAIGPALCANYSFTCTDLCCCVTTAVVFPIIKAACWVSPQFMAGPHFYVCWTCGAFSIIDFWACGPLSMETCWSAVLLINYQYVVSRNQPSWKHPASHDI